MNVIELKQQIEDKILNDNFLILIYSDISFIAQQYILAISEFKNKELIYIDFIEAETSDIFNTLDNYLYVLNTDKFDLSIDPSKLNNVIVITKTVDKKVIEHFKDYIVEIPKIKDWHKLDYVKTNLPGLSQLEVEELVNNIKDTYRLLNEVDKLKLFNTIEQPIILKMLNNEENFSDINLNNIFNFTNAITRRDITKVKNILSTIKTLDIEAMGVVSILYNSFKNIINIQLSSNATAESLNMSSKQFYALKYSINKFTNMQLIDIFKLITSIDKKLKYGELPNEKIIDYLLINIL